MKIKDLPQEIKELVFERQKEAGNQPNEDISLGKATSNFIWEQTKEDRDFWEAINNGNFAPFYEKYPQFKTGDKVQRFYMDVWQTEILFYGFYNPYAERHVVYSAYGNIAYAENVRHYQAPIQITESEIKRVFAEKHNVSPEMIEICK